jgi:WhiB family redox-sensing transcriptional regulator
MPLPPMLRSPEPPWPTTEPVARLVRIPRPAWQQQASCRGMDPEVFHCTNPAAALAVCQRCPVRLECLAYALEHETNLHDTYGTWGGATINERRLLRRQVAAGADPMRVAADHLRDVYREV